MICSLWIPQAVRAAAELGLPDLLAAGPMTGAAVAARAGTHADATLRLLRALSFLGFFTEDERGFALTDLGRCLTTRSAQSRRAWARVMGGEHVWQAWGRLTDCVRTGRKAYASAGGVEVDTFDAMARDPEAAAVFHQAMAEMMSGVGPAIARSLELDGARTVVDVGGGCGALLCAVLDAHPALTGVVFDLDHARTGAEALFAARGLAERARYVAGSFFETAPPTADLYLLKSVIHDWDDARSLEILGRCRDALSGGARLALVEAPAGLPSGN
ncbi:MAG TPA: methyltransferase, partial [Planctomycetota bacterium]|nr:methyltransferase [Planctomycetota bacterium]